MNFEELEASLPNGLHDAKLRRLEFDYVTRTALMDVALSIGDPDATTKAGREGYRDARIEFTGFAFAALESPGEVEIVHGGDGLRIDAGPGVAPNSDVELPSNLPDECFVHWIFVSRWNSFIHIAAVSAKMSWLD
jgi:hypothetical protein